MPLLRRPQDGAISITEYELFWLIAGILMMLFFHKPSKPAPKREAKAVSSSTLTGAGESFFEEGLEDMEEAEQVAGIAARIIHLSDNHSGGQIA